MRALIFTAFLLCLGTSLYAQRDTIYDVDNFYEYLFDHNNTQQLNSGFLLDKAFPFTDIKRYNGTVHDSSTVNFIQLKLAYSTRYNMWKSFNNLII